MSRTIGRHRRPPVVLKSRETFIHATLGGGQVCLRLSNLSGTLPLVIGAAHITLPNGFDTIQASTDTAFAFGGSATITIPSGAPAFSAATTFAVQANSNVAISLFTPTVTGPATYHLATSRADYVGPPVSMRGDLKGGQLSSCPLSLKSYILHKRYPMPPNIKSGRDMTTLYKFVTSKEAVRKIASGYLKFTKIEELNDPSELAPMMNQESVRDSLALIRRNGYSEEQFKWLGCQEEILNRLSPETRLLIRPASIELANKILLLPIYDNLDLMEMHLLRTINLIRSRVGVLSLTEKFDSLPMWAHYGAQAKGYVVRFDGLDQEFRGDATGSLDALKQVEYVETLAGITHDPSTQDNLFFRKFNDWRYEREWRVVSALSSCQLNEQGISLRSVDPLKVTGVICGWNVDKNEVDSLAGNLNPEIKMIFASLYQGRVIS